MSTPEDLTGPRVEGSLTAQEIEQAVAQGLTRASRKRFFNGEDTKFALVGSSILVNIKEVLDSRDGSALDNRSILKTDYVPSQTSAKDDNLFPIQINGTFHLRQSSTTQIFGVAQPTIAGIRGILNLLGAGRMRGQEGVLRKNILWINLREEPTLYVNGRSTVLRERYEPFHNIDQLQGIDPKRIRDLEVRLKEDLVEEAAKYNGNVVLHEEKRRRELEASWEAVTLDDILTPDEVFFSFNMQGYRVKYVRIPTTPEKAPTPRFFDALVECLMDTAPMTTIVLNCQTGVSRSTVGMVAAGLVQMWRGLIDLPIAKQPPQQQGLLVNQGQSDRNVSKFHPREPSLAEAEDEENADHHAVTPPLSPKPTTGTSLNAYLDAATETPTKSRRHVVRVLSGAALSSLEESLDMQSPVNRRFSQEFSSNDAVSRQLEAGWYQPTLNLLRLIDSGREAKKHVDFFSDDASHLVNIRSNIFIQRSRASQERHQPSEKFKLNRAAISLLRYLMLITFDAYLASQVETVMSRGSSSSMSQQSPMSHFRNDSLGSSRLLLQDTNESAFPLLFSEWLRARPEIIRLLDSVEKKPAQALEALDLPSSLGFEDASSSLRKDMREAMDSRRGSMLNTDTILKADHFPGGFAERHGYELPGANIRGAPNFRRVEGTRVYGVCTPTMDAAASIVSYIQAASNAKKVVWTNLREEPVVYINKHPFVLRSVKQPFRNVNEFVMIDPERLEAAEMRLKNDILSEAKRYNGRILVHTEAEDRSLQLMWESVTEEDVMTPREVYESLAESGLPIDYARVPLTPEQPPSPIDIDGILARVRNLKSQPGAHFVFNCQLGRGRSTTAMVIALLELQRVDDPSSDFLEDILAFGSKAVLKYDDESRREPHAVHSRHVQDTPRSASPAEVGEDEDEELSISPPHKTNVQQTQVRTGESSDDEEFSSHAKKVASAKKVDEEFGVILSLVRVLSNGITAKKWADISVDRCGDVENIRRNISENLERAATARTSERSEEFIQRGLLNLRRYFMLILVAAHQICFATDIKESFSRWYYRRPELKTIFNEIQGREALRVAADKVLSGPPPSEQNELAASDKSAVPEDQTVTDSSQNATSQFVARRDGMVLTRGSILKSDHFPGCNRLKGAKVVINGAPNFREIISSDVPEKSVGIYGTGIPTVEGLRGPPGVLEHVSKNRNGRKAIIWVNLREEPILYVNGRPFVLRKLEHPFENLEHTGISKDRVEDMESRLKVDVLNEIIANKGRLLVHDEDESGLQPAWVQVDISEGSTSVQTPRDLYAMFAQDFNVKQYRVPITDEQAPKVTDYDEISNIVRNAPLDAEIVFNCQMGRGRTTTGLVIGSAVRLWERRELWKFSSACEAFIKRGVIQTKRKVHTTQDEEEERYLMGQYEAIGALTRVLDRGNASKATTDAIIDTCDALQNLREAIVSLRQITKNEDKSPMQRAAAFNRGVHYLRRYYQLIEFVDYLFSSSPEERTRIKTFAAWLRERRELKTIIKKVTLD